MLSQRPAPPIGTISIAPPPGYHTPGCLCNNSSIRCFDTIWVGRSNFALTLTGHAPLSCIIPLTCKPDMVYPAGHCGSWVVTPRKNQQLRRYHYAYTISDYAGCQETIRPKSCGIRADSRIDRRRGRSDSPRTRRSRQQHAVERQHESALNCLRPARRGDCGKTA